MNREEINDAKTYPLSNEDINRILDPDTRIFTYPELAEASTIQDMMDELGRCIMLYPIEDEASGHWVCLWKKGNTIHYWDPYGKRPEAPKKWVGDGKNEAMGQAEDYLTNLLQQSGCRVFYNTFPYQKMDDTTATCGKWCVCRLILKHLTEKQFHDTVMKYKGNGSSDNFAVQFVHEMLGK